MARLLIVTHTAAGTGFGRVAIGVADALAPFHDVSVLGLKQAPVTRAWQALETRERDIACTTSLREAVRAAVPDGVLLIGVNTLLAWQAGALRRDGFRGALIAYVPLEGPVGNPGRLSRLEACSAIVPYTRWARAELLAAGLARVTEPIGHGVRARDTPSASDERKQAARRSLFPSRGDYGATWILYGNRNDARKSPEMTVQAFAAAAAAAPDTQLVMHCEPTRCGVDLKALCERLGLAERVIFTHDFQKGSWSEEALDRLYRACDVGISSSWGEGWGLVAFEHALRGAAQILPAHATLREIWQEAAVWASLAAVRPIDSVSLGQPPRVGELARAIIMLSLDKAARDRAARACRDRARLSQFGWHAVGAQWASLLSQLLPR